MGASGALRVLVEQHGSALAASRGSCSRVASRRRVGLVHVGATNVAAVPPAGNGYFSGSELVVSAVFFPAVAR